MGKWKTTTNLKLDKEVVRSFVDTEGNGTNEVLVDEDDCDRQRIIFFLRTVESLKSSHPPATLVTPTGHAVKRTRDVELQPMGDSLTATKKQRTMKEANAKYLHSEKPAWEAALCLPQLKLQLEASLPRVKSSFSFETSRNKTWIARDLRQRQSGI